MAKSVGVHRLIHFDPDKIVSKDSRKRSVEANGWRNENLWDTSEPAGTRPSEAEQVYTVLTGTVSIVVTAFVVNIHHIIHE